MSEKLIKILEEKGSLAVLKLFGLDKILTGQDDPDLWAMVLASHWSAPGEPDLMVEGLRFGLALEIPATEGSNEEFVQSRSGMHSIKVWCFKTNETGDLFIEECGPESSSSFFTSFILAEPETRKLPVVKSMIDIQRPSLGCSEALVHVGTYIPPNMGQGDTRRWIRETDGNWLETNEIVFNWIA